MTSEGRIGLLEGTNLANLPPFLAMLGGNLHRTLFDLGFGEPVHGASAKSAYVGDVFDTGCIVIFVGKLLDLLNGLGGPRRKSGGPLSP